MSRIVKFVYIYIGIVMFFIPVVMTVMEVRVGRPIQENRPKASKPFFNENILHYAGQYHKYFCDNYFGRDLSINIYNYIKFYIFYESPVPDRVLIGNNNYLFRVDRRKAENVLDYKGCSICSFQGFVTIPHQILTDRYKGLITFKQWLADHNIKFYLVVVPDKETIYPEKMPQSIKKGMVTPTDQIINFLEDNGISVIDLRIPLWNAKNIQYELYYQTDSHWNKLGAYVGYLEITAILSKDFNSIKPIIVKLENVSYTNFESKGDLLLLLGAQTYPYYREAILDYPVQYSIVSFQDGHKGKIVTQGKKGLPRALIYRDSMFCNQWQYLANNFSKAVFIWDYLWANNMIDSKFIESEKFDIVIIATVERYLKYYNDIIIQ